MINGFKKELIRENNGVVAGVSGGADSVCLLLNLCELRESMDFDLTCVYVEHGIRGEASLSDGRFVEELCGRLSVDFMIKSVDVPKKAKAFGLSEEEAARELRYEALLSVVKERDAGLLAVAHNADDNAETILFQMIRGTGVAGLMGMEETTRRGEVRLIRPMLHITRKAIEEYLETAGQDYVTDATNLSDEYSRNRLRLCVMPELLKINDRAVEHINSGAAAIRELYITEDSAARLYEEACGGRELSVEALRDHSPSLVRSVIRLWIRDIGMAKDVGRVHYEAIQGLIDGETGRSVDLPNGQRIERVYDRLRLRNDRVGRLSGRAARDDEDVTMIPRLLPGEKTELSLKGMYIRLQLYAGEDAAKMRTELTFQKNYAKYYDYGKIDGNMVFRHRREGDFLVISEDGKKKPLARYFVDEKIPREEREAAWLLCTGSKVILAPGYRGSEDARVSEKTEELLVIEYWRT